jgi:XTP/dITP diphosphohydrolase
MRGKVVFFATGNIHKFNEARVVLAGHGLAAAMLRMKGVEIQSDSLQEIAATSALDSYKQIHLPLIVEDAGLFVDALKGFPGPYAAYAYKTLGNEGLLKQMGNLLGRKAIFRSAIAYCEDETGKTVCFEGEAKGKITLIQRKCGNASFGFDPIFQPEGSRKTFAEMTLAEKNGFSHRAQALNKFAQWYKQQ